MVQTKMDVLSMLVMPLSAGIVAFVTYMIVFREKHKKKIGEYSNPDWNYCLKVFWARYCIRQFKNKHEPRDWLESGWDIEPPTILHTEQSFDSLAFYGTDQLGNSLLVKIHHKRHRISEVWLQIRLENGDVYQLPHHPNTILNNKHNNQWISNGLRFTVLEPFKRIRITYKGQLRNCLQNNTEDEAGEVVFVKFNMIFSSCSAPFEWPFEQDTRLLSQAAAREHWTGGQWINLITKPSVSGFDQYGAMLGEIEIGESSERQRVEVNLASIRTRRTGSATNLRRYIDVVGATQNGTLFNFGAYSSHNGLTNHKFGHVRTVDGKLAPITEIDINLRYFAEEIEQLGQIETVNLKTKYGSYQCILKFSQEHATTLYGGLPWNFQYHIIPQTCLLNTAHGTGMAILGYEKKVKRNLPDHVYQNYVQFSTLTKGFREMLVWFEDEECKLPAYVGGKAASLSLLISQHSLDLFVVPNGFCLTVEAFNYYLSQNPKIVDYIRQIELIATKQLAGDLDDICQKTREVFYKTPIDDLIENMFLQNIRFLRNGPNDRFAVRSSSIYEDTEELSAAGQNETILGCLSDDILYEVPKCWASLFSVHSVEYRRQNGLPINCAMAVIIQRMVAADVAGVLFTCDPFNGNPGQMVLTANYGLGETVVSALVEPDTYIIKRTWRDHCSILSKSIGKKSIAVIMDNKPPAQKTLTVEEIKQFCITDGQALELAEIGIKIDLAYGVPCDIEWAIAKNVIYLLQVRPVTSLLNFTKFELLHEFDTPVLTDTDVFTFANAGEVMPKAMSALGQSLIPPAFNVCCDVLDPGDHYNISQYLLLSTPTFQHRLAINVISSLLKRVQQQLTLGTKLTGFLLFGYDAINSEMHQIAIERYGYMKRLQSLGFFFKMIGLIMQERKYIDLSDKLSSDFRFDLEMDLYVNAKDLMKAITRYKFVINDIALYHQIITGGCAAVQILAFTVMDRKATELQNEHIQDIGLLLSSCQDLVSNIPSKLQDIIRTMRSYDLSGLKDIPTDQLHDWMRSNCPNAAQQFDNLLESHGHRGIAEFDPISDPWIFDPTDLLQALKIGVLSSVEQSTAPSESMSMNEVIAQLAPRRDVLTRVILKQALPLMRRSVINREKTKSACCLIIHRFRLAYRRLGHLMEQEGRLPDPHLIHHLTHSEIEQLIFKNKIELIRKAMQRRKLYPEWNKLKFAEIYYGTPKAIESKKQHHTRPTPYGVVLKGTPVNQGDVTGRACVITNLTDAHRIQPGDVLITQATDIGWSPYFAVISGIVTELGGLISHGAVVAREYGIPCLVGVQDATSTFQTGDFVTLTATTGEIRLEINY